jgi:hypothetical protein
VFLPFTIVILLTAQSAAAEWTIGITHFGRAQRLTIEPDPGTSVRIRAGTREIILNHDEKAGLLAVGSEIDLFAKRQTSTSRRVQVDAPSGEAAFSLRADGQRRRYRGVLDVTAAASGLQAVCRIPDEAGRHATDRAGRHHGFDFCDKVHCGFHLDPLAYPPQKP